MSCRTGGNASCELPTAASNRTTRLVAVRREAAWVMRLHRERDRAQGRRRLRLFVKRRAEAYFTGIAKSPRMSRQTEWMWLAGLPAESAWVLTNSIWNEGP